jgi:hypothetical protein
MTSQQGFGYAALNVNVGATESWIVGIPYSLGLGGLGKYSEVVDYDSFSNNKDIIVNRKSGKFSAVATGSGSQ